VVVSRHLFIRVWAIRDSSILSLLMNLNHMDPHGHIIQAKVSVIIEMYKKINMNICNSNFI